MGTRVPDLLLDSATLLLVSTLISLVLGAVCLLLSWGQGRVAGWREWGMALLGFGGGSALLAFRGVTAEAVSIDLGNALVLWASGLCWIGARRFDARPAPHWLSLPAPLVWLLLRQWPGLTETVESRVLICSLLSGPLLLAAAWEFRAGRVERSAFRHLLAGSFTLHGLLILGRGPWMLMQDQWSVQGALPSHPAIQLILLETALHGIATTFCLLAIARERQERQVRAALAAARDAAEEANAAKSRFLARMSHELRTPLNGVLGLSQALVENPVLPPSAREEVAVIERAGRHLLSLVNDVLDLASVEAGRMTLQSEPVSLRAVLDGALELVRPEARRKQIHLREEIAADCPPAVLGDRRRLQQVLLNLLANAVKFTPPRGVVRVVLRALPGGCLRLDVIDTGPGIPAEKRSCLFQDFSRLAMPDRGDAPEGHGLGLAISAALVQRMGGRIGVGAGADGQGSQFWVELVLPFMAGPPVLAPAAPLAGAGLATQVLVVDDVAVNRLVVQALLQNAGCTVRQAESGEAALALIGELRFDLVLLDIQMAGLDGLETARRIRAAERLRPAAPRVTILALTGEVGEAPARLCREAGMDGHLPKPVTRESLLSALQALRRDEARNRIPAPARSAA